MCGVVGCIIQGELNEREKTALIKLLKLSGYRGRDGYGWAKWDGPNLDTEKSLESVSDSQRIDSFVRGLKARDRFIFNTRAAPVTEGAVKIENVHPHLYTDEIATWAVVHNGIVSNDKELAEQYNLNLATDVDTEVIAHLLGKIGLAQLGAELIGGFAVCGLDSFGSFSVLRNYKTLYQCVIPNKFYLVASEQSVLQDCFPNAIIEEFPKESYLSIASNGAIDCGEFEAQYLSYTPSLSDKKALVVISGGMDSSLVAYIAQKMLNMEVSLIHFDYAHKSLSMELEACQAVAKELGCSLEVVDLSWLGHLGNSPLTDNDIEVPLGRASSKTSLCWVPARNLVMLSLAAAYAEAKGIKYIFYGSNLEEEGPAWKDNDQAAVEAFDNAFFYGTLKGVRLFNVLGRLMKRDIITLATHLGVPLDKTCSCDEPVLADAKWLACGKCGCCHNRRHAFIQAGLQDPQNYAHNMIDYYPSIQQVGNTNLDDIRRRVKRPESSPNSVDRVYRFSL